MDCGKGENGTRALDLNFQNLLFLLYVLSSIFWLQIMAIKAKNYPAYMYSVSFFHQTLFFVKVA